MHETAANVPAAAATPAIPSVPGVATRGSIPHLPEAPVAEPASLAGEGAASGAPAWLEAVFPWMLSFMLHAGVALLLVFAVFVTAKSVGRSDDLEEIIVPEAMLGTDIGTPGGVPNPGTGGDPTRDAAQNRIKNMMADGWADRPAETNVRQFLGNGDAGDSLANAIYSGTGGALGGSGIGGMGGDGGPPAPYGTPGGGTQAGLKSSFYGTGGNAVRIVYILDRSGGMLTSFDDVKRTANESIGRLLPIQQFAVIMCGVIDSDPQNRGTYVPPSLVGGVRALLPATLENRRKVATAMDSVVAKGQNDDLLKPFEDSFRQAFELKPQLIYFLTDGAFDPSLLAAIKKMNAGNRVRINTIAFGGSKEKPGSDLGTLVEWRRQLQVLAKEHGGMYKWVPDEEMGRY